MDKRKSVRTLPLKGQSKPTVTALTHQDNPSCPGCVLTKTKNLVVFMGNRENTSSQSLKPNTGSHWTHVTCTDLSQTSWDRESSAVQGTAVHAAGNLRRIEQSGELVMEPPSLHIQLVKQT
eukprot:1921785-Rhodomonas_salina.2